MMPEARDIRFIPGNTLQLGWEFRDQDTDEVKDIDAIGFVFRIVDNDDAELLRLSTADDTMTIDSGNNLLAVLTPSQTRDLPRGANSTYEVEARFPLGEEFTWVRGRMIGATPVANDDD